jgi:hypothetical protein
LAKFADRFPVMIAETTMRRISMLAAEDSHFYER